jgi:hypothetical protein
MATTNFLPLCDGCGQAATPEHIARRLQRLEWATRFRPVHIGALFLGAWSPIDDNEFLYCSEGGFAGEAGQLLKAVGISTGDKTSEAVLSEFQRSGLFLTHILECPLEKHLVNNEKVAAQLANRLPAVATRIRRSLKPRRVILITEALSLVVQNILALDLGCPVVLSQGNPVELGFVPGEPARPVL